MARGGRLARWVNGERLQFSPLPLTTRFRKALLESHHPLKMRFVLDGHFQHAPEAGGGPPRGDKIVPEIPPPLIKPLAVHQMISGGLRGIEQVAVGIVFVLLAPGVAPVIENLASKQVSTH